MSKRDEYIAKMKKQLDDINANIDERRRADQIVFPAACTPLRTACTDERPPSG